MDNIALKNLVYKLEKQTSNSYAGKKKFLSVKVNKTSPIPYNIDIQISTYRYFVDFIIDSEAAEDGKLHLTVKNSFPRNLEKSVEGERIVSSSNHTLKIARVVRNDGSSIYHDYYLVNMTLSNAEGGIFSESDFDSTSGLVTGEGFVSVKYGINYGETATIGLSDVKIDTANPKTLLEKLQEDPGFQRANYSEKIMDLTIKSTDGIVFSSTTNADGDIDRHVQFFPEDPTYGQPYNILASDTTVSSNLIKSNIIIGRNANGNDIIRVKKPETVVKNEETGETTRVTIGEYGGGIEFTADSIRFIFG